jgi:hypothetical protein
MVFHFSFNQNKLWTNWRSKGLLYTTNPVFKTVGPVETNVLTHKPIGLLTCDILEVRSRFYWPGSSGLWLSSKTVNISKKAEQLKYISHSNSSCFW